ncbi:LysR family transcriptional regulator [Sphingomonas sp. LB-2]|uniref:LysR family transcriptional regulator n=1 Tax=Sphingomonas caeni TaxID=2984949 RepID=UPI00222F1645|nr:LysR family transcriptional regulator [Sphingomonas caeni]MCW3846036.1 LysR family transcriptional regulator [Sphingomonas caeni]
MPNSEHGVQALNTDSKAPSNLRWDDLKAFSATARHASLRAAAEARRVSVNTVRASLARVEEEVGAVLFRRSRDGIQLTDAGTQLLEQIRKMGNFEPAALDGAADGDVLVQPGELRIACSEALGSLWLTPRLDALSRLLPGLRLNLQLSYDLARDRSGDHDVGLTYHLPTDPDIIVARLATMHMMLFASPDYIAEHGDPQTFDDLREHRFVEQVSNGVNSRLVDHLIGPNRPNGFVPICSNSAITQFWAVARGVGVGAFPTYVTLLSDQIVPLSAPLRLRFELYYFYHANAKRSPSILTTIAWLKEAFSTELYPWFADRFIHPRDFPDSDAGVAFTRIFFRGSAGAGAPKLSD